MISCDSGVIGFYKQSHVEDIDVLPLIEPYKLWTPIPGSSTWFLDFKKEVVRAAGNIFQTNVCEVNVANHIIYGHCISLNAQPKGYFVVIPKENLEMMFQNKEEWDSFLKERNVNSNQLFDVLETYNAFNINYKTLPWYKEIMVK